MKRRPFSTLGTATLAVAFAAAVTLAEAAFMPDRTAEAALWALKINPFQAYCEGCCSGNNLCCELQPACSHPYPAEPQGGG